ncbi:hypothetical protein FGO68_gene13084 [Halteria grandinella]|uniref:Transmembrane protein n=1 Tax=Halteria grandinella TaxID=5974 RepID=A0A8J8NPA6_HALGN|nr:hypothetical protein FGO68_gene13084 [Halteria grandinella]
MSYLLFIALFLSVMASQDFVPVRQFELYNTNSTFKQCYLKYSSTNALQFRCDYKNNTTSYQESKIDSGEAALSLLSLSWPTTEPVRINYGLIQWAAKKEYSAVPQPYTLTYQYEQPSISILVDLLITWSSQNKSETILQYLKHGQYFLVQDIQFYRFYGMDEIKMNGTTIIQMLFLNTIDYGTPVKQFDFHVLTFKIDGKYVLQFSRTILDPPGGVEAKQFKFLRRQYIYTSVTYQLDFIVEKYFDRFTFKEQQNVWGITSAQSQSFQIGTDQVYVLTTIVKNSTSYALVAEELFNNNNRTFYQNFTLPYYAGFYHTVRFTGQYLQVQNDSVMSLSIAKLCSYKEYLDVNAVKCVPCAETEAISITPYGTRCYTYDQLPDEQALTNWYKFNMLNPGKYREPSNQKKVNSANVLGMLGVYFISILLIVL